MPSLERDHILELFAYHHWATDSLMTALAGASADQLDEPWGGSFKTGRGLLRHVVGAEWIWCERWNGRSPRARDFDATWNAADFRREWEAVKAEQQSFLEGLSRNQLLGDLTYLNLKGEKWTHQMSDILFHVVNHGTYHRGQLAQFLRDRELPPASTDYLIFVQRRRSGAI